MQIYKRMSITNQENILCFLLDIYELEKSPMRKEIFAFLLCCPTVPRVKWEARVGGMAWDRLGRRNSHCAGGALVLGDSPCVWSFLKDCSAIAPQNFQEIRLPCVIQIDKIVQKEPQ